MHRQLDEKPEVVERVVVSHTLTSTNPATGEEIWSGRIGDAAAEVATARAAQPAWAAHSLAYRVEAVRRFANVVRKKESEFAELISKETGKPFGVLCISLTSGDPKAIETLNKTITAQWQKIDALTRQVAALSERLQDAEAHAPGATDEPPPHY